MALRFALFIFRLVTKYYLLTTNLGGVAQMARACGSYPQCPEFESQHRHQKYLSKN